jgi:hypothetical protein
MTQQMKLSEIDARLQRAAVALLREKTAPIDIGRTLMKLGANIFIALGGTAMAMDELAALYGHLDRPDAMGVELATIDQLKGGGANGNQKIH